MNGRPTARTLNAMSKRLVAEALDENQAGMEAAYERTLREYGRQASALYLQHGHALVAAGEMIPPTEAEVIDLEGFAAKIAERTRRYRENAVDTVAGGIVRGSLGISFDVGGVFSQAVLDRVGIRLADAEASMRMMLRNVIEKAVDNGWTVQETATAIREYVNVHSKPQAKQLARTDLIGVTNASSIAATRVVFPNGNLTKIWLATEDERTRETHAEADGQRAPLNQPFTVGGFPMDFPGDPNGPDAEVCNCRCTIIYDDLPQTAAEPEQQPDEEAPTATMITEPGGIPASFQSVDEAKAWALQNVADQVSIKPTANPALVHEALAGIQAALGGQARIDYLDLAWNRRAARIVDITGRTRKIPGSTVNLAQAGFYRDGFRYLTIPAKLLEGDAMAATAAETREVFALHKQQQIERLTRIAATTSPLGNTDIGGPAQTSSAKKLQQIQETLRWTVDSDAARPLFTIAAHEATHILDYALALAGRRAMPSARSSQAWRVSEYAASEPAELFAEVGAMVASGRSAEVPADILLAFMEVTGRAE